MITAAEVERAFDAPAPLTIGVEEELMLLDPHSLELAPVAAKVIERVADDRRFKLELPASQLEIITAACGDVDELATELAEARADLAAATRDLVVLAAAGVHPFAAPEGELNGGERYAPIEAEFRGLARRQLVFALQVHVAPGSAELALAIYNELRSLLPEIAALAANAPFYDGADTGLASVRPKIAELLPRQGVPPPLSGWDEYAAQLEWGVRSGALRNRKSWWWELRPNPSFGTLELRVPDAQTTVEEAAAIAAFVHLLVAWLRDRHAGGEPAAIAPAWRIEQNRWRALRDGVEAELADLVTGDRRPARDRLRELVAKVAPYAEPLGCASRLTALDALIAENGAIRQRHAARAGGPRAVTGFLQDRFLA